VDDGHPEHVLDVYLPEGEEELLPTLFVVHGLRFSTAGHRLQIRSFSKRGYGGLARHFAQRGYAVVLIDYQWPSQAFQEQMTRDAFCALAWVHANAETYGFDRQRIALLGVNWGAAIAAKLAAVDDRGPFLQGCPHPLLASALTPPSTWPLIGT